MSGFFSNSSSSFESGRLYKRLYAKNRRDNSFAIIENGKKAKIEDGSFEYKFEARTNNHKESQGTKNGSILGMSEYADFGSHLAMRIMDYRRIRKMDVPRDEKLYEIVVGLIKNQCMNGDIFSSRGKEKLDEFDRRGGGRSSRGGFFDGDRSDRGDRGDRGGFFGGGGRSDSRDRSGGGGFFDTGGDSSSFFGGRRSSRDRGRRGEGGFFGGDRSNSRDRGKDRGSRGGFFGGDRSNSRDKKGGFFGGGRSNSRDRGKRGGGFFDKGSRSNSRDRNKGGGFFNSNKSRSNSRGKRRGGGFFSSNKSRSNSRGKRRGGGFFSSSRDSNKGRSFFSDNNKNSRSGFFSDNNRGNNQNGYVYPYPPQVYSDPVQNILLQQMLYNQSLLINQSQDGNSGSKGSNPFSVKVDSDRQSEDWETKMKNELMSNSKLLGRKSNQNTNRYQELNRAFNDTSIYGFEAPVPNSVLPQFSDNFYDGSGLPGISRSTGRSRKNVKRPHLGRTGDRSDFSKYSLSKRGDDSFYRSTTISRIASTNIKNLRQQDGNSFYEDRMEEMKSLRKKNLLKFNIRIVYLDNTYILELELNKGLNLRDVKDLIIAKIPNYGYSNFELMQESKIIIDGKIHGDEFLVGEIANERTRPNIELHIDLRTNIESHTSNQRIPNIDMISPPGPNLSKPRKKISNFDDSDLRDKNLDLNYNKNNSRQLVENMSVIEEAQPEKQIMNNRSETSSPNSPKYDEIGSSIYPKLTKPNYITCPPMQDILRMDEFQLASVTNFSIENSFGKIEFYGQTDLRDVNLDISVIIKANVAEVYPDDVFNEINKPMIGSKLNKKARITLYNIQVPITMRKEKLISKLKKTCIEQEAKFVSFDWETRDYTFEVYHFTKYGFENMDSDDEDSEDEGAIVQEQVESHKLDVTGGSVIDGVSEVVTGRIDTTGFSQNSGEFSTGKRKFVMGNDAVKTTTIMRQVRNNEQDFGPLFDSLVTGKEVLGEEQFNQEGYFEDQKFEETQIDMFASGMENLDKKLDHFYDILEAYEREDSHRDVDVTQVPDDPQDLEIIEELKLFNSKLTTQATKSISIDETVRMQEMSPFTFDWRDLNTIGVSDQEGLEEHQEFQADETTMNQPNFRESLGNFSRIMDEFVESTTTESESDEGSIRARGEFLEQLEVISIAHCIAANSFDQSELNFMDLFCVLFGIPSINNSLLKGCSYNDMSYYVQSRKYKLEECSLDSDRRRSLTLWLKDYLVSRFSSLGRMRQEGVGSLREEIRSNQLSTASSKFIDIHNNPQMALCLASKDQTNDHVYKTFDDSVLNSEALEVIKFLEGKDDYAKESFIGQFAYELLKDQSNLSIKNIYKNIANKERTHQFSDDDKIFYAIIRLYTEVEQGQAISNFIEVLLSAESREYTQETWLLGQYLLANRDTHFTNQISQELIRMENKLLTLILTYSDINQFYQIMMLSLNKYNKEIEGKQLLKIAIERDSALNQKKPELDLQTVESFSVLNMGKEIALYRATIQESIFEHKRAIRILEEQGLFERAFDVYYKSSKLGLISRNNERYLKQFEYLLDNIGDSLIFKGDRRLIKAYIEFEKHVYNVDKDKAQDFLDSLIQELSLYKPSTMEDSSCMFRLGRNQDLMRYLKLEWNTVRQYVDKQFTLS